jgi:hypothetical protein
MAQIIGGGHEHRRPYVDDGEELGGRESLGCGYYGLGFSLRISRRIYREEKGLFGKFTVGNGRDAVVMSAVFWGANHGGFG